jgi:hypothetical protein
MQELSGFSPEDAPYFMSNVQVVKMRFSCTPSHDSALSSPLSTVGVSGDVSIRQDVAIGID